jgi:hypothetical protein
MYSTAKAAANRVANLAASRAAELAATSTAETGRATMGRRVPAFVAGHNFAGQSAGSSAPPDTTGAIGPTRYIQHVNISARIVNRGTHATISTFTLNTLYGQPLNASSFDPQILWDNQTQRFYYLGDTIRAANDNVLSFGWSTGPSPSNGTTHWCKYEIGFMNGSIFPDYPKLGDSRFFIIFGTNDFLGNSYVGSTVWAIGKPPAGPTCPNANTLIFGARDDIRETGNVNERIFTPVPANDIDSKTLGYWVAMDEDVVFSGASSSRLYIGSVGRNAGTGAPIFNNPKNLTVASYGVPAGATQPAFSQRLDTLDGRPTQANMARNPDRRNTYSFWTQHTIRGASANSSFVRWYEINPWPLPPTVLRTGNIGINTPNTFFFNGAISPDRRADGGVRQFGDSFVINYNVSRGGTSPIAPRIVVGSSFNGGALSFATVRFGLSGYRDFTCPTAGSTCRWGDYAAANPDPKPQVAGRGVVWGTNQFSGVNNPPANGPSWRTRIFAHRP